MTLSHDKSRGALAIEPMQESSAAWISRKIVSMDPWLTLGYGEEGVTRYLLRPDPSLERFVLLIDGEPGGVLTARSPWLFGPFIELIALFGENRGRGIGREVIEWLCRRHRQAGNLWATVSSFNFAAQGFYARLGFEVLTSIDGLVRPGFSELLLRKRLDQE